MREIHVSKKGNDNGHGTKEDPFLTISKAADIALKGDCIIVHEGVYREHVSPNKSGADSANRITYQVAPNECVTIKGSEIIDTWEQQIDGIWKVELCDSFFGDYNPYNPSNEKEKHTGQVYLNASALAEVRNKQDVQQEEYTWTAEVIENATIIYANFAHYNPNEECVEIHVRKGCFYPLKRGVNYITVKGFEMSHAACMWGDMETIGLLWTNESKGWIIEENKLHDTCYCAIAVKNELAGDEAHVVRRNEIYNCGQHGIVTYWGAPHNQIYENNIYNIGLKSNVSEKELEISGIKILAPIDDSIYNNNIWNVGQGIKIGYSSNKATEGIERSLEVLHKCYNTYLTVEDLAEIEGVSSNRYRLMFREIMGVTPKQYLIQMRMTHAQELLRNTDLKITDIASKVGYKDLLYFDRFFKKYCHCTPTEFREKYR